MIDLRIARTDYGLCDSVMIRCSLSKDHRVRFSYQSKYSTILGDLCDSGPVWNRGKTHSYETSWRYLKQLPSLIMGCT